MTDSNEASDSNERRELIRAFRRGNAEGYAKLTGQDSE